MPPKPGSITGGRMVADCDTAIRANVRLVARLREWSGRPLLLSFSGTPLWEAIIDPLFRTRSVRRGHRIFLETGWGRVVARHCRSNGRFVRIRIFAAPDASKFVAPVCDMWHCRRSRPMFGPRYPWSADASGRFVSERDD